MNSWVKRELSGIGLGAICAIVWLSLDYITGSATPKPSHDFFTIVFAFTAGYVTGKPQS